jgi:hypothetical protein
MGGENSFIAGKEGLLRWNLTLEPPTERNRNNTRKPPPKIVLFILFYFILDRSSRVDFYLISYCIRWSLFMFMLCTLGGGEDIFFFTVWIASFRGLQSAYREVVLPNPPGRVSAAAGGAKISFRSVAKDQENSDLLGSSPYRSVWSESAGD